MTNFYGYNYLLILKPIHDIDTDTESNPTYLSLSLRKKTNVKNNFSDVLVTDMKISTFIAIIAENL